MLIGIILGLSIFVAINITHIWRILTTLANYLPVLVSPAILLQLTILIIIVATSKIFTKIKLRQLGLFNMEYLFQGLFVFVLISIFIQFTQICNRWFIKGNMNWMFQHSEIDIKNWIHSNVEFFLVGFHEELLFRVVIFLCLYKWLAIRFKGKHQNLLLLSVLLSQIIFSLYHFPLEIIANKQSVGILIEGFLRRLMAGLLLLFAYIRTRNLYVPIFIHLLIDFHIPLFYNETSMLLEGANLVQFYSILLLIFWPKLFTQAKPYVQSEELPLSYNKDKIV
ncbi:CPBP family intramembrane glutamic endopeptidase [Microbacteriaceae bacterium 4G12]